MEDFMSRYLSLCKPILAFALPVVALVFFLSIGSITAQSPSPIDYGTVQTGTLTDANSPAMFSFSGTAGDLLSIRVIGISPNMDPNVTLVGPSSEVLASNDNSVDDLPSLSASLTVRLTSSGTYTILVSGTPGDFLVSLEGEPAPIFTVLELDIPFELQVPLSDEAQAFSFNTDPLSATTLLIDANPFDLDAVIAIRSSLGETVALFRGNLDNACISLSPGDELHEVRVLSQPNISGTITFTLGRGPCELGEQPAVSEQPQPQLFPVGIEGKCAATSIHNVNVRSGPGVEFPVLTVAVARQPVEVLGTNQNGTWFFVQTASVQGWLAAPLVILTGPCGSIVNVTAPPVPQLSPTPGLPLMTPTAFATEGTAEATDEGTPEVTPEVSPEVTVEVTQSP
jgi:hypothetical protein